MLVTSFGHVVIVCSSLFFFLIVVFEETIQLHQRFLVSAFLLSGLIVTEFKGHFRVAPLQCFTSPRFPQELGTISTAYQSTCLPICIH